MNKSETLQFIAERQRRWAMARGLTAMANGRVTRFEDNLFSLPHKETESEFKDGDGDEFGTADKPGKICSLHSSSALVCNMFDYWRKRPMLPLLRACGFETAGTDLRFEQKFPTGVGSRPANLDVLITGCGSGDLPIAVESKFTEPFQSGERDFLKPSYFREPSTIWDQLPICRRIAKSLTTEERFKCLKVGQLLKHALGLTRKFGKKQFVLLYLWYDVNGSDAARQHRADAEEFGNLLGDEVLFRSDTYQNVFEKVAPVISGGDYEEYLRSRYFG